MRHTCLRRCQTREYPGKFCGRSRGRTQDGKGDFPCIAAYPDRYRRYEGIRTDERRGFGSGAVYITGRDTGRGRTVSCDKTGLRVRSFGGAGRYTVEIRSGQPYRAHREYDVRGDGNNFLYGFGLSGRAYAEMRENYFMRRDCGFCEHGCVVRHMFAFVEPG